MAWWLVQQLAIVTLLIVVVHAVSRVFSLGPATRHALWAIVLIKLVTPPLVSWPWTMPEVRPSTIASSAATTGTSSALFTMLIDAVSPDIPANQPTTPTVTTTSRARRPSWTMVALSCWIVGSVIFGAVQLVRTMRLARLVRRSRAAPLDALERLAEEVARTVGVRAVPVQIVEGLSSPMVWAVGRPRLLWPADLTGLDAHATRALLTHELAHIKRRDHWVGWLDLAAGLVWWWTPMYWHARRHIREHAELACDGWAAAALADDRRAYADALLALCASPSTPPLPASALGIHTDDRRFLERRLAVIMRSSAPVRLSRVGLCAAAFVTCLVLPAFAQRPAPTVITPVEVGTQTAGTPVMVMPDGTVVIPQAGVPVQPSWVAATPVGTAPAIIGYPATAVVAPQSLPAEAQALLNSYNETAGKAQRETEERLAKERTALIEKLQKLQDSETKAGHLDEAVAIRDRVRQLQASPHALTMAFGEPAGAQTSGPAPLPVAELPPFHPEVTRRRGMTNPVPLKTPKPNYTPEAMRAKIAGTVRLDVLIDETGAVTDARVQKSLDDRFGLDQEALLAARQWTFRPALDSAKKAIPIVVVLELDFRLRPSPDGQPVPLSNVPPSAEQRYKGAFSDYMMGRWDTAILGFRSVIDDAPGTSAAQDARFQIGEAFYQQGRCQEALTEYEQVAAGLPRSHRAAEAIYMQGVCYSQLDQQTEARQMFQQVVDRFPNTTQSLMAERRLRVPR